MARKWRDSARAKITMASCRPGRMLSPPWSLQSRRRHYLAKDDEHKDWANLFIYRDLAGSERGIGQELALEKFADNSGEISQTSALNKGRPIARSGPRHK